jgi:hypothetical protein
MSNLAQKVQEVYNFVVQRKNKKFHSIHYVLVATHSTES